MELPRAACIINLSLEPVGVKPAAILRWDMNGLRMNQGAVFKGKNLSFQLKNISLY